MIITITNNRGGVGKSTTAQTLAIGLMQKGKKVLLIDLDPQCNTTATFKADSVPNTIYKVLNNECIISDAIYQIKGINIIASDINLINLENTLNTNQNYQFTKHQQLKIHLDTIKDNYDYIIIDTAPNLSLLTTNAMYTSDYVLIPMLADIYSVQGLKVINDLITSIREGTDNKRLKIVGLLLTHYKAQTLLNQGLRDMLNQVATSINTKVYTNVIRDSIIFSDSQATNDVCLLKYPNHNASIDYKGFINEFLKDMEDNKNG